jgi:hypothetical protein
MNGFGVNPEGKRPLGRPKLKYENNIKMRFRDNGMV